MPSAKKLHQLFTYDKERGELIRRVNAPPKGRVGDVITSRQISTGGRENQTAKIIWCLVHGTWPSHLVFKDGDNTNHRIENLELKEN